MATLLILAFFGVTFLYAGILVAPHDLRAAVAGALIGIVLMIKPLAGLLDVVRTLRASRRIPVPRPGKSRGGKGSPGKSKKGNLRIVRTEENDTPPTIH